MPYRKTREQELAHYKTNNCEHSFDEDGFCFDCGESQLIFSAIKRIAYVRVYQAECDVCNEPIESDSVQGLKESMVNFESEFTTGIMCSGCKNDPSMHIGL